MDQQQLKALSSKEYDTRKKATLEIEKQIGQLLLTSGHADYTRARVLIRQLVELSATSGNTGARNGGIMGLAGAAIAMGQRNLVMFLDDIAPPILASFHDADHRVRYFACESMYNVAKVAKGEILVYFNELFDAMSKLAADADQAVKNGGELLDRLIKDIVVEQASTYVSIRPTTPEVDDIEPSERSLTKQALAAHTESEKSGAADAGHTVKIPIRKPDRESRKTFSLERFIPLLAERIYVINPFARTYLIGWISILDSIPELEIVSYLPEFLDGLMKFLGDPTEDITNAASIVLAELLKEIREAAEVTRAREEAKAIRREKREEAQRIQREKLAQNEGSNGIEPGDTSLSTTSEADVTSLPSNAGPASRRQSLDITQRTPAISPTRTKDSDFVAVPEVIEPEDNPNSKVAQESALPQQNNADHSADTEDSDYDEDAEGSGSGHWVPGQGVYVDHAAIIGILLELLKSPDQEIQAICLQWIAEFILFARSTVISFTPRLIPVVLSSIAHHVPAIRTAALQTNYNLFKAVQQLPSPVQPVKPQTSSTNVSPQAQQSVNLPTQPGHAKRESISNILRGQSKGDAIPFPSSAPTTARVAPQDRPNSLDGTMREMQVDSEHGESNVDTASMQDSLDYQATVNALTLQFLHDNEETRVAALQWLSMLHQKAPKKILSMHDGTFPALLKTLSDSSEDVIKADLQLLAQISLSSEEDYFPQFMGNLLSLFSTDRKLLEARGSLIIRQLCSSLNAERIYRIFADLLEKDEDLDFASIMVQNLHLIMITSPELSDFRKRLRNLETRDGQILFSTMYRSWSHNAVAAFSLCLLAQAYEHAANLLQIFADLEVTVSLLIQIDKLVQLLESPVFTSLRLQLLEPEKNPYLFKCLYGLLMFLPQSSAFLTLRNRLNAVSPLGFMHVAPKSTSSSTQPASVSQRSTIRRGDDIKWQELLIHFRQIQLKHERSRRTHQNEESGMAQNGSATSITNAPLRTALGAGGLTRRKGGPDSASSVSSNRIGPTKTGGRTPLIGNSGRPLSPQFQSVVSGSRISSAAQKRLPAAGRPKA